MIKNWSLWQTGIINWYLIIFSKKFFFAILCIWFTLTRNVWRGVRAVEGARLESVYTCKRIEGSNPSLSENQTHSCGYRSLRDARLRTPPGPEGSNGSSWCGCRSVAGTHNYAFFWRMLTLLAGKLNNTHSKHVVLSAFRISSIKSCRSAEHCHRKTSWRKSGWIALPLCRLQYTLKLIRISCILKRFVQQALVEVKFPIKYLTALLDLSQALV